MENSTFRILAAGEYRSNNTRRTGLNNNDLIIGPSGAGKTRSYVKPNIMQCNESMVIADTKGNLYREVGPLLKKNGYRLLNLDFTDTINSCGYNPFDYIGYNWKTEQYSEQDIMTVVACIVPVESHQDPFWDLAARIYLASMVGYVLECLPREEQTLEYVAALFAEMPTGNFEKLFEELGRENPKSFAYQRYKIIRGNQKAEKMYESIRGILAEKLNTLTYDGPMKMYSRKNRVDFSKMGKEKTAVFLTISDVDRSMDRLASLFYTQALQSLCRSADKDYPDSRLPVPVRFILDDFAANFCIPDFDKITSVIRSREIYVSIILQSISQLESLYTPAEAKTIINNCDNCLYLGGQDVETARYIGIKADRSMNNILNMPLGEAYLFTRGSKPKKVEKYDIRYHERYAELPEAAKKGEEYEEVYHCL